MQTPARRSVWSKMLSALWLGIPLGCLQIAIIWFIGIVQVSLPWLGRLSWGPAILLGAFFYLLLPAIEGFRTARRGAKVRESASAGWLVSYISLLVVFISLVIILIVGLVSPHKPAPARAIIIPPLFAAIIVVGLFLVILLLNSLGMPVAYLGGLLGGRLGQRHRGDNHALHGD